jgi:hypothetical protein
MAEINGARTTRLTHLILELRWQKLFEILSLSYHRKTELEIVDYLDLFFHEKLFSTMVEYTNVKISDLAEKVSEVEMCCFIGIMFGMTVCPMNNIVEYWTVHDDGLFLASRFHYKLNMSLSRFNIIRKYWAIGPAPRGTKTFDAI